MRSVSGKTGAHKGHKVTMHLRGIQNGVLSTVNTQPPPRQGNEPMMSMPPEPIDAAHSSMEHLTAHIQKHMGHLFGKADAKSSEGGRVKDAGSGMEATGKK